MRYKVTVTEQVPGPGLTITGGGILGGSIGSSTSSPAEVDGAVVFSTTVGFLPSLTKLVAALTPPRIRKPRSAKAS
jgi:hypothetical protein